MFVEDKQKALPYEAKGINWLLETIDIPGGKKLIHVLYDWKDKQSYQPYMKSEMLQMDGVDIAICHENEKGELVVSDTFDVKSRSGKYCDTFFELEEIDKEVFAFSDKSTNKLLWHKRPIYKPYKTKTVHYLFMFENPEVPPCLVKTNDFIEALNHKYFDNYLNNPHFCKIRLERPGIDLAIPPKDLKSIIMDYRTDKDYKLWSEHKKSLDETEKIILPHEVEYVLKQSTVLAPYTVRFMGKERIVLFGNEIKPELVIAKELPPEQQELLREGYREYLKEHGIEV